MVRENASNLCAECPKIFLKYFIRQNSTLNFIQQSKILFFSFNKSITHIYRKTTTQITANKANYKLQKTKMSLSLLPNRRIRNRLVSSPTVSTASSFSSTFRCTALIKHLDKQLNRKSHNNRWLPNDEKVARLNFNNWTSMNERNFSETNKEIGAWLEEAWEEDEIWREATKAGVSVQRDYQQYTTVY